MSWHVLLPSHPLTGPPCQALVPAPPAPSPVPPLPVSPVHRRPPSGHSLQNKGSSLAPSATLRSLQSKGLSRVFSNTTVQKHQFFGTQLSF